MRQKAACGGIKQLKATVSVPNAGPMEGLKLFVTACCLTPQAQCSVLLLYPSGDF